MDNRPRVSMPGWLVGLVMAAAVAAGVAAAVLVDFSGSGGSGLGEKFDYDVADLRRIDPALIQYAETGRIPTGFAEVHGLAVGPEDQIYVAGDKAIRVFDKDGARRSEIATGESPRCLAVAGPQQVGPGSLYVGFKDHVEVYDPAGARKARWEGLGPKAVLTSIAVSEEDVYAADFGNRIVLRYSGAGKLLGRIGQKDEARKVPGFLIPSPYFDIAMGADGLLRVANTGCHRIEAYTPEGDLEFSWGKPSVRIDGFCGCCNPTHFAILPNGSFVTTEKGIPRVKVLDADGKLVCVVAGPKELAADGGIDVGDKGETAPMQGIDVAVDSRERILLLDPAAKCVRVFVRKKGEA
ncbi:MAG: NHL repeat-containing protein [Pirellulales bacterium]